jgi:lipopolysaccharide export system permease protein
VAQTPARQDTVKARTDSIRASIEAESRRADSVAAAPVAPATPPAVQPAPVGTRPAVTNLTPPPLPSAGARAPAPSQGVGPPPSTNAKGEKLTARQKIPDEVIPAQIEGARLRVIDTLRSLNRYEVEIHKKFALAAACFIFVLLGAPIALRFPRAGVGLTIGVSLVVFGLYYVGLIAGESLARRGMVPPFVSMWIANVVFGVLALILLSRMGKESGSSRSGDLREVIDNLKYRLRRHPAPSRAPRSAPRTSLS